MLSKTVFLFALGACSAASMENRQGQYGQLNWDRDSSYAPVQEYGYTEPAGDDFDVFSIILPLLILGGLLLALSSLSFTLTTGRAMSDEKQEPQLMDQLHDQVESIFYSYLKSLESEQCIARAVCDMGVYSKDFKSSAFILSFVEPLVPEGMKGNMAIFKTAALSGQETGKCKKYKCAKPKLA